MELCWGRLPNPNFTVLSLDIYIIKQARRLRGWFSVCILNVTLLSYDIFHITATTYDIMLCLRNLHNSQIAHLFYFVCKEDMYSITFAMLIHWMSCLWNLHYSQIAHPFYSSLCAKKICILECLTFFYIF